jgi:hypothetical protein
MCGSLLLSKKTLQQSDDELEPHRGCSVPIHHKTFHLSDQRIVWWCETSESQLGLRKLDKVTRG